MARKGRSRGSSLPEKLKAYGYARVSTDDQAKEGISLDLQEQKIEAYAMLRDLTLIETIRDEGYSGKDLERPGLERLLRLIQSDEAEAVIVYKLDRLTRSTGDLLNLVENKFKRGNTRFLSITEQIDTETAMGKFFLTIMGAMAQMERELISERTAAAFQYKREKGDSMGLIPYGYNRRDGQLIENQEEMRVIRRMKRWRKEGLSYRKIADRLNERGTKPRRKGSKWYGSSVRLILKRRSIRKKVKGRPVSST